MAWIESYNQVVDVEIGELEWDAWNEDHIAKHGVLSADVDQMCRGRPRVDAAMFPATGRVRREFLDREREDEA